MRLLTVTVDLTVGTRLFAIASVNRGLVEDWIWHWQLARVLRHAAQRAHSPSPTRLGPKLDQFYLYGRLTYLIFFLRHSSQALVTLRRFCSGADVVSPLSTPFPFCCDRFPDDSSADWPSETSSTSDRSRSGTSTCSPLMGDSGTEARVCECCDEGGMARVDWVGVAVSLG